MFHTLSNFTYARAQPLTQRINTYQTPNNKSKFEVGNSNGSLGKTIGILKKQNIRPKSPIITQNELYRSISRSNSDYQLGLSFSKSASSSFFQQSQRQPQQMRNQNYKITTSRATKTMEQIESLNQKIQRLSQRVSSNEQQIFYLKSTKQSRIIPGLNLTDLKTMIQENHSKRLIDQSHIEQLKLGIESLRQDLQKTVKKRQFECEIKSINFKLRDLNNEIKIQANELVYQMLEKAKKQINLTIQSPRLSKFNDQIQMKFIQLNDFTKKIELEMQKSLIRIKNIQNLLKNHQNSERNKQIQSLIKKQQNMVYRSDSVFSSIPIKFTVEERLSHQNKQFKVSQTTYLIDEEGYLLDQEQHYLLNSMGQQIRLTEKQLKMLRSISVMS